MMALAGRGIVALVVIVRWVQVVPVLVATEIVGTNAATISISVHARVGLNTVVAVTDRTISTGNGEVAAIVAVARSGVVGTEKAFIRAARVHTWA